jgi:integrase
MANRRVTVWKYVQTGKGWRYCKPAIGRNGKIKPDWVVVNGKQEEHKEGAYYIRYREGDKQVWERIGDSSARAVHQAETKKTYLAAKASGIPIHPEGEKPPLMISSTLDNYLEEYRLSHRQESHALMKQTLEEFKAFNYKNIISQITRLDLLKYKDWLIQRGRSERTAGNKMLRVQQYLRTVQGQKPGEGLITVKDAKFVEREPEVYGEDELERFFAACDPFQLRVFKTLLMSGLRKQELESLTWADVDFTAGTIKVSAKPGFSPKDWEERTIEIPKALLALLQPVAQTEGFVFANGRGHRYTHLWDDCNAIAKKAGVTGFHPHKFRSHYATTLLQAGVDLKTVQKLLGHKDLESTMRYLARAESGKVRAKVDAIWAGKN